MCRDLAHFAATIARPPACEPGSERACLSPSPSGHAPGRRAGSRLTQGHYDAISTLIQRLKLVQIVFAAHTQSDKDVVSGSARAGARRG